MRSTPIPRSSRLTMRRTTKLAPSGRSTVSLPRSTSRASRQNLLEDYRAAAATFPAHQGDVAPTSDDSQHAAEYDAAAWRLMKRASTGARLLACSKSSACRLTPSTSSMSPEATKQLGDDLPRGRADRSARRHRTRAYRRGRQMTPNCSREAIARRQASCLTRPVSQYEAVRVYERLCRRNIPRPLDTRHPDTLASLPRYSRDARCVFEERYR